MQYRYYLTDGVRLWMWTVVTRPEMEFLDIISRKDSSLLLDAIHRPFYWRILKKIILFSGFKNPYKKSAKQENSSLSKNSILEWKNESKKPDKNLSLKRHEFMPSQGFGSVFI